MKKEIKIIVAGYCNSGKTSMAQLIEDALRPHGIEVEVIDPDRQAGRDYPQLQPLRLQALAQADVMVTVEVVQTLHPELAHPADEVVHYEDFIDDDGMGVGCDQAGSLTGAMVLVTCEHCKAELRAR